jgi:lon-related putative ATP-dependent protease
MSLRMAAQRLVKEGLMLLTDAVLPLSPDRLYTACDPAQLAFDSTAELEDFDEFIGQPRAASSLEFAVGVRRHGYNLFVMGPAGTGKHAMVARFLSERARQEPCPSDWVYVNNFEHAHKPLALELPPGRGGELREAMARLVDELRMAIPAIFDSDEYRTRGEHIDAEFADRHEKAFGALSEEAATHQVSLLRTPNGFSLAPVKNGEVIAAEDYEKLPAEEKKRIESAIAMLQQKLERIIRSVMQWRKERFERFRQLNREMTLLAVGHLVDDLKQRYHDLPRVLAYLDAVREDVIDHADDFRNTGEAPPNMPAFLVAQPSFRRYQVNVVIARNGRDGAPVVIEEHPTYQNLIGRMEHMSQFGTLTTDFTLIKPGALHRAAGGYLVLDAHKVLTQWGAWDGLKRALSSRTLRLESLAEMYSMVSTVTLEPQVIPLDIKVVLIGDRRLYYLLYQYDVDFAKLFKVCADFEDEIDRSQANATLFARMIATALRREKLLPFDRGAVARMIEHSSRETGDAKKLSGNISFVVDLLGEADYWARSRQQTQVALEDVQKAIDARLHRNDRLRERVHEQIHRGTVMIDTEGARVGQINALSVYEFGNVAFAEPTRVTATTRLGDGDVIDVQREVDLGGSIHSKGVLILSAFLAARYSGNRPHALSASLVFEQTYGEIDGDSASLAELCALLSSLADVPIRQSFAVTGSVNQLGQVQAIGAVNEKIEGFYDICCGRGLTGEQGVLIPASNVEHLMLRRDVVDAAAAGKFRIYPVASVDEAITLLTGVLAGEPGVAAVGADNTINGRVARRLQQLTALRQSFSGGGAARRSQREKDKHG